jgi:hypothetical protein
MLKPNIKILFGILWFAILIIYVSDRVINNLDIRIVDWIGWVGIFTAGLISVIEGIKMKKNEA